MVAPKTDGTSRFQATPALRSGTLAEQPVQQTVLQQHCAFWDRDKDGIIWPLDTYRGFRDLGLNFVISFLAIFIIHGGFSYPTVLRRSFVPDPLFRIYLDAINMGKHGSDTGSYDSRGYFRPEVFESMFERYASTKAGFTLGDIGRMVSGQRLLLDPFGWSAAIFEWWIVVLLTWDCRTGICAREDILGIFDGTLFWQIKKMRDQGRADELPGLRLGDVLQMLLAKK
ncbi:hypothetical protein PYCC9005_004844 [Savitreella phatthalungensis]